MTAAPARPSMRSVRVAVQGKGRRRLVRRVWTIGTRYGVSPARMDGRLARFLDVLERHGCSATLPITTSAVERHPRVVDAYASQGIEFAVHGHHHVDHRDLSEAEQDEELGRARRVLRGLGVPATGFRAPYLRFDERTMRSVRRTGFQYDASQGVYWPIDDELVTDAYMRGLAFYGAESAESRLSVPWIDDGLVRIPYSLPDDESLVERLSLASAEDVARVWSTTFRAAHRAGELFTVSLHPERVDPCAAGIDAVLTAARAPGMHVWVARLHEIAEWWRARVRADVHVIDEAGGWRVRATGPAGLALLIRGMAVRGAEPWTDGYARVFSEDLELPETACRPFVGVHPDCPVEVTTMLREQGYLVEPTDRPATHSSFVSAKSASRGPRAIVGEIEANGRPLVRLGRWPDGARSALAVSGDVDALTLADFVWRVMGR